MGLFDWIKPQKNEADVLETRSIKDLLALLLERAKAFGLPTTDLNNAHDFLLNREYGLCLDTVTTQLYEHEITIDDNYYKLIVTIAKKMDMEEGSYQYLEELISKDL
jgi:hypothetical protein